MHTIQTPFPVSPDPKFSLNFVGSCHGLLCLAPGLEHNLGKDVYIWNLIIRKYKKLPLSRYSDMFLDEKLMLFRLWFGFHEPTNDYKVVRLIYFIKNGYLGSVDVAPLVEVYSLRSDSWKIVRNDVPLLVSQNVVAFHKGVFYWRGFKGILIRPCMMSFNLDDEMFSEIEQPLLDSPCSLLAVKGSSDSVFSVYSKLYGGHNGVLELWKMGENGRGWMKAYTIECNRGVGWTIGFTRSNKFLYVTLEERLISFDLESLKTEFHDVEIPFNRFAIDVNYMESLLLFDH
ncbi:F-box associated domain, type 1 [Artemisia annua]|uniref:F-box associated domain, type 1 n=1 Tax=Artemisia annua TaxID=35608 RepID=A0A2U1KSA9_ARTAN|nr:F-box associated domain, type 1 [Artemisia annua]